MFFHIPYLFGICPNHDSLVYTYLFVLAMQHASQPFLPSPLLNDLYSIPFEEWRGRPGRGRVRQSIAVMVYRNYSLINHPVLDVDSRWAEHSESRWIAVIEMWVGYWR
jgi:hypothetical protein